MIKENTITSSFGLDLEKEKLDQQPEDFEYLGASLSLKCIAEIPEDKREIYLPAGEIQKGAEDTMDCASRAPVNILETKFNYLVLNKQIPQEDIDWLSEKGYIEETGVKFSDRFIAIKSGTTRNGNSLKAPLQACHEWGMIPKSMFPLEKDATWDQYHDASKITPKMERLGKEFLKRFRINYDRVKREYFPEILEANIIDTGGYAWSKPKNGEYPRVEKQANHAFMVFGLPAYSIFDNYLDEDKEGDYIKKLAPDYKLLGYGYRLIINLENAPQGIFARFWAFLRSLWYNK